MTKPSQSPGRRIGYMREHLLCHDSRAKLDIATMDHVFRDQITRKKQFLSEFAAMMAFVREGDTLIVQAMDQLGRSAEDFLDIVYALTSRGVRIEFVTEKLLIPAGANTPIRNLILLVLDAFTDTMQFWRRERSRESQAESRVPATEQSE